jgi:hypothetical protein
MRTPITLQEFLFTLNQDEDTLVTVVNYKTDEALINHYWKDDLRRAATFDKFKKWYVQDFVLRSGGLEITIVESKEELD